jgi:hypothetical protein
MAPAEQDAEASAPGHPRDLTLVSAAGQGDGKERGCRFQLNRRLGLVPYIVFRDRYTYSPPSVHQMVLALERAGLVRRQPGVARSIEVLVAPELLPVVR